MSGLQEKCADVDMQARCLRTSVSMMSTGNGLIWVGAAGAVGAVVSILVLDMRVLAAGVVPITHTVLHGPLLWVLRCAFFLIAMGLICRSRGSAPRQWRRAVVGAMLMLACAVAGEFVTALAGANVTVVTSALPGAIDSIERRLLRLAAMAAYAVPMLTLLAAAEHKGDMNLEVRRDISPVVALLVRWEPVLFAIGVISLASILAAAAMLHKELIWALPIGADTTLLGCGAAAIRARWRCDHLAFGGWLAVCASMLIGLLMGSSAFGGPLPAPGFIGGYEALPRMLLRDVHIMMISIGVVAIATGVARVPHRSAS